MQTLSINFLINDSPTAVSILDKDLKFLSHSDVWFNQFGGGHPKLIGKSFFEVLSEIPEALNLALKRALQGDVQVNKGSKFIRRDGQIQYFKWHINAWKDEEDTIGGVTVFLEDVTAEYIEKELLYKAEKVSRTGGWEVDLLSNEIYWSPQTKEIHEVAHDYVPSLEKGINFYKKGKHRDTISALVAEAITEGTPWDIELIIVTAKGKELWVRAKGEAEFIGSKCVRLIGTFQDIDKEKKGDLAYKRVSDRLEIATKAANIGIWDYDIISNDLAWDDEMYHIYGIEKKDFKKEYDAWSSALHPDDRERAEKELEMAIAGLKEFDTEFRIIWPNGEIRCIKASGSIQCDSRGRALKVIGTNWDITELKTTQLKLKKSEESFQGALENSNIGMALVGLQGQWLKVNPSLCRSLGYTEQELLQKKFQEITHPEDLKTDLTLLAEIINGERESYQIEKRYFHKNGHTIYAILTVTAEKNIDGELSHFVSQVMDISQRIKTELKYKETSERLMNFAHIVSHNLKSHSSNLSMLTEFLKNEKDEEEKKGLANMLVDASESLNETVVHLNEVVQVKVGATEKLKWVNLLKTIRGVNKNLSLLLQEKNTKCFIDIPKDVFVSAIPAYLDSIFLNLFSNSIKYSSPSRSPEIRISIERRNGFVVLTFADNGIGIDLKRHGDKLFGMYKTFHRNKDSKGIGLFITRNQIEAMNGKIEVESEVNIGTTFRLYFEEQQYVLTE